MADEARFIAMMRGLAKHPAARGLNDDAAVLPLGDQTLVLTHDAVAEGVHYLPEQDMADVAWKLTARTLSDLAAKGARPHGVLLGYMLSGSADDQRFAAGLGDALAAFDAPLLGGDTISAEGKRLFSMTAIGEATSVPVPARNGAQPGESVFVTGPVGGAMIGYEALSQAPSRSPDPETIAAYCRPRPLIKEGIALAPKVSAMMDISDGLLLDAQRMARSSGVTIALDSAAVPIAAPEARRMDALRWGDDYQLLLTAPPGRALPANAREIGDVLPARDDAPLLIDGKAPESGQPLGFQHQR